MKQNFTHQDLLKLLYNETTASETLAVNEGLHSDPALKREFQALVQARQQLPAVSFRPSRSTVRRILNYSRCAAVGREA
jgi:anti-sigma factor RsiW